MSTLLTLGKGVRQAIVLRRRLRGPLRASWDETYETVAAIMHHYVKRSGVLPLTVQRRMMTGHFGHAGTYGGVRVERVDAKGVPASWFRHDGALEGRVLYYLHGGGYVLGSVASHSDFIARLCVAMRATGFAIDYRLAPEHRFPAQLHDSTTAYRWLLANGVKPSQLVIAGESAGGGLTLSTLVQLQCDGVPLPACAVCISPWLDLEASSQSHIDNEPFDYLNRKVLRQFAQRFVPSAQQLREPLAAPLFADLAGLPPLLLHAGGAEVLLDDAVRVSHRAKDAGVQVQLAVYPDMIHAWHLFAPILVQARTAIDDVARFVEPHLG